jgi:acetyl-CoA acetyltransferase
MKEIIGRSRSATRAPTSPRPPRWAGLPDTVAGVQLNRFCASGLEAVNIAAQKVASGWEDLVFAGGVESMSRVPMGSDGGAWAMDPRPTTTPASSRRASAPT